MTAVYLGWPHGTLQEFVARSGMSPKLAAAAWRVGQQAPPLPPAAIERLRVLLAPTPDQLAATAARDAAWAAAHRRHRPGTRWTICPALRR